MEELILSLIYFLKSLSYMGLVIALTIEFIPAEIVLPLAGYWVFEGDMLLSLAILAGLIGGITGPLTLYLLGKYGGRPLILKYGKYIFLKEKNIVAAERFFAKYGASVAFWGRFVPGIRTVISIPCGMANMNIWIFTIYTGLAMLPITCVYVYLGYKMGEQWEMVAPLVKSYATPIVLILLLLFGIYLLLKKKIRIYYF